MKTIQVPPSKSIAHRAVICASLAAGESRIEPIDLSDDIEATCRCMSRLGADIRYVKAMEKNVRYGSLIIRGIGASSVKSVEPETTHEVPLLDCGESGSTLRFLLPVSLAVKDRATLTGSTRLMERPLGPFLEALKNNGAVIFQENQRVETAGGLHPGVYLLPGDISSQYVTGLLLALPLLTGDSEVVLDGPLESKAYVDLTIDTMRSFGVMVEEVAGQRYRIAGKQQYASGNYQVESDYSNAAFFLVAGALGTETECLGLREDSKQGDREILKILQDCGARLQTTPRGGLVVRPGDLKGITVDVRQIPDLVPILAVLFSFCNGESKIINAGRLRIKESDRLRAITEEMTKIGGKLTEGIDSLTILGSRSLQGGRIRSHNDHRIAMALAIASLRCENPVEVEGSNSVNKSYPAFWEDFSEPERVVRI